MKPILLKPYLIKMSVSLLILPLLSISAIPVQANTLGSIPNRLHAHLSEYKVPFPNSVTLVITKGGKGYIISQESTISGERLPLFEVSKINSLSVFEHSPEKNPFGAEQFPVLDHNGQKQAPTTWFMIGSEHGYHFLRKRVTPNADTKAVFQTFSLAGSGHKPEKISLSYYKSSMEGFYYIASLKEQNSSGQTVVVRESDASASLVASKYLPLIAADGVNKNFDVKGNALEFKSGESFSINFPGGSSTKFVATAVGSESKPSPPVTSSPNQTSQPSPVAETSLKSSEINANSFTFKYNEIAFSISSVASGDARGTYITRATDKLSILISHTPITNPHDGFSVEQGILKYSKPGDSKTRVREIDLEAFKLEATWKLSQGAEAAVKTNANTEESSSGASALEQAEEAFINYRSEPRLNIKPIQVRNKLVEFVLENLGLEKRASTILTGESGDIPDIMAEAIRQLPRTWKVYELDSSKFGDGLGISGAKESKILKMEAVSRLYPTVFYAEDFESLRGLGSVQGDSRDVLDLLKKPIRNGTIKVIGTGGGEFRSKVKDPSLVQVMQVQEVDKLTHPQVVETIVQWMRSTPRFANEDLSKLQPNIEYLIKTAKDFNVTELDPNRSINLLDKVKPPLSRASIDEAAGKLYKLDPSIRERTAKISKLNNLMENLNSDIVGHEHLKKELYDQTRNYLAEQHDGKGPGVRIWLDGPPGAGKTELAMSYAKAMGLEYIVIEMSQIKSADQLMELLYRQLEKNPFSVIIMDEIDKLTDKKILEAMLTFMNQQTNSFSEKKDGVSKERTMSSSNSKLIVTSNLIGRLISQWYKQLPADQKEKMGGELMRLFLSEYPMTDLVEYLVKNGVPEPFIDRFLMIDGGISFAFPPTTAEMVNLLKFKLGSSNSRAKDRMMIDLIVKNEMPFLQKLARKYRENNMSSRQTIGELDKEIKRLRSDVYYGSHYEEGGSYIMDLETGKSEKIENAKSCKNVLK